MAIPSGLNRVIARPFVGRWPNYQRTYRRQDFSVPPQGETSLDRLHAEGVTIASVGKIGALFSHRGISSAAKAKNNSEGVRLTLELMRARASDFVFTNLVDFDSKFGHRRDPPGYAAALETFDAALPAILDAMKPDDLLLITADHGNDPTYRGTDHTREYVPVLAAGPRVISADVGTRSSFADLGATVCDYLGKPSASPSGASFLADILS
jgi:phosphopentomutase